MRRMHPMRLSTRGARAVTRPASCAAGPAGLFRVQGWRIVTLGLCLLPHGSAVALELPRSDEATDFLAPRFIADLHPRWTADHHAESLLLGDMLLWPAVTVGPILDSNPFQQTHPKRAAVGVGILPAALIERESGVHRTLGYLAGDLRFYPDIQGADVENGRVGLLHDWALRRDLTVRLQGEIARTTDPFNTTELVAAGASPGLISRTDLLAAGSVQKTFDRLFVSLSGTALRSRLDASRSLSGTIGSQALSSETVGTARLRVGYLLPANLIVFAEPAANWRAIDRLSHGSTGTRAVAGVAVARFGLLSGEIFAGWQAQSYPVHPSHLSEPVVGGRIAWSATRAWTATVGVDQTLGDVAIGTAADPLGTPEKATTALATLRCALSRTWTAQAEAGAVWIDYPGTRREDRLVLAGFRGDYALARSIDLTARLHLGALHSTVAAANYRKTVASLAATYHY